jgi:pimeloyl-ACP methyl ester carboxylesterase
MQTATVNDTTLAYERRGEGEPVLLLHPGFVANAFAPLMREPSLAGHQLIAYHRRGYGASAPVQAPFGIAQHASDCLALMDHLEIACTHLVGHSFGANVALEVARQAPGRVHSLALLEPPLPWAMQPASLELMLRVIGSAMQLFSTGDVAGAVDEWLNGAFGSGWQAVIEQQIPGGLAQVIADGSTALGVEGAALQSWLFGPENIRAIEQPTLAIYHVDTNFTIFDDVQQVLLQLLPRAESLIVPNTTHLLQIQNPRSVGEGLAAFFARYALAEATRISG